MNPINTIYAAGPIDLGSIPKWRNVLIEELRKLNHNIVVFDPSAPYLLSQFGCLNTPRSNYIEKVNEVAMNSADAMVCVLSKSVASIGTPIELDQFSRSHKHIFLVTDIKPGQSVYLDNRMNDKHLCHGFYVDGFDMDSINVTFRHVALRIRGTNLPDNDMVIK